MGWGEGVVSRFLPTVSTIGIALPAAVSLVRHPRHRIAGGELITHPNVIWLLLWVIYI